MSGRRGSGDAGALAAPRVVRDGTRALRSTGYPSAFDPSDPLNYEKALLDDWLAADFPRAR